MCTNLKEIFTVRLPIHHHHDNPPSPSWLHAQPRAALKMNSPTPALTIRNASASLPVLLWLNSSWKLSNFCRIIFSFEKGIGCTFFGIFLANCLGVGQIFKGQKM